MENNQNNQEAKVNTPRWKTWTSTNKTPLLIIFLTFLTALLVVIAVSPKQKSPSSSKTNQAEQAQKAVLTISSPVSLGDRRYEADVKIDSGNSYATGADLFLTYDPKVLSNVVVSKGTFIATPIELFNTVDPTKGTINYSINTSAGTTGTKGSGTIAVITFTQLGTSSVTTSIDFGANTDVTAEANAKSILEKSVGATFSLGQ